MGRKVCIMNRSVKPLAFNMCKEILIFEVSKKIKTHMSSFRLFFRSYRKSHLRSLRSFKYVKDILFLRCTKCLNCHYPPPKVKGHDIRWIVTVSPIGWDVITSDNVCMSRPSKLMLLLLKVITCLMSHWQTDKITVSSLILTISPGEIKGKMSKSSIYNTVCQVTLDFPYFTWFFPEFIR